MPSLPSLTKNTGRLLEKHGIVLAGAAIFGYYLWSAIDLFRAGRGAYDLQEYVFQFDSLIFLWLLLWVGVKLMEYRRRQKEEAERHRRIALEYERQRMRLDLLDEVTTTLTDAVNNPLSIISISAGSIREQFTPDSEVVAHLDRIEGALRRLQEVLTDFQQYHTRRIIRAVDSQGATGGGALEATADRDPGSRRDPLHAVVPRPLTSPT
jgi:signal transduction histidine kinase